MALISAPSLNSRFTALAGLAVIFVIFFYYAIPSIGLSDQLKIPTTRPTKPKPTTTDVPNIKPHPIDTLIRGAGYQLEELLKKETADLRHAAQAYRDRRGRQPPPGFDVWFEFAKNHSAVIVEDFFDPIYHNLNPFWGVPAKQIREQANDYVHRISVRDGVTSQRTDIENRPWLDLWQNLTQTIAQYLPDVDMAINEMDESRMVVPWEEIDGYMEKERQGRRIVPEHELKDAFRGLKELDKNPPEKYNPEFSGAGPYWPQAVIGCPPESAARKAFIETNFTLPPPLTSGQPPGSFQGYVENWTLASSPCDSATIQGLHGTFVEPISVANTKKFFPLFGGSKLPMNNEILLPAAMYWTEDPFYSGGKDHGHEWDKKKNAMVWRGAASGGRNKRENWTRFQRHRFVSMVNATSLHAAENGESPPNFVLPANDSWTISAASPTSQAGSLSKWVDTWSDAAVVHLLCFPAQEPPHGKECTYTDPYFRVESTIPMKEQYNYKYLPDIDGNSFSGRYRGFLGSTSLPIKATIYQEWHDSRLVPWKHFVPMDNTFIDIYGIMEYFVGNEEAGVQGHDEKAKAIALEGKAWAEKVLRREDMQIYVFRLLLEYARLCDDDRDVLGWKEGKGVESGVT